MQAEAEATVTVGKETVNIGQQVGEMIVHHITNSNKMELPFLHEVHLPELPTFDLAGIPINLSISKHVVMLFLAAAILLVLGFVVRRRLSLVPRGIANFFEAFVGFIYHDIAEVTMGHSAAMRYTPFLCTAFFFILTCNLLGLVPYGATATGNISVTAGLAFLSFVLIQYAGMRKLGVGGYLKHLVPPGVPWWLAPVMFLVEVLGVFAKPFALCIRLFANMVAGHVVILSLIGLIFVISFWVFPVSVAFALFIYLLELFVAVLQAYIFTMLTSLFVGLLVAGGH